MTRSRAEVTLVLVAGGYRVPRSEVEALTYPSLVATRRPVPPGRALAGRLFAPAGGTDRGRLLRWTAMNGPRTYGARLLVVLTSLALLLLLARARRGGGGDQGPHRRHPRTLRHGRLGHVGGGLRPHRQARRLPAAAGRAAPAGLQREARHLVGRARRLDGHVPLQHAALHRRPRARRRGRRRRRRLPARLRRPDVVHHILPEEPLPHGDGRHPRLRLAAAEARRDAHHRPRQWPTTVTSTPRAAWRTGGRA